MTDMPSYPSAAVEPHERVFHGDTFVDPYEWMRNKDDPRTQAYVREQNAFTDARMAPLAGLRTRLFEELKSRVEQTDMSVPTRINDYWYFARTQEGKQYAAQCRIPIAGPDDWTPPEVDPKAEPGSLPGEQVIFDANREAEGHDFFRLGGLDLSRDGRWMLYGVDFTGDERYDLRIRDLSTGEDLPETIEQVSAGGCLTPDGRWAFYVKVDDAWRPYAIWRHRVGTPASEDVEAWREDDERFWAGVGLSFDERNIVIGTGSKTTTEVLTLPVDDPTGTFTPFIPRREGVEYDVSFARFEGAGDAGEDVPVAVVYHNVSNPNFQINVIDMRRHEPPYDLDEGTVVASGSPYGCETGGQYAGMPVGRPWHHPGNPTVLDGARGLGIEGIAIHRHFVLLSYRADGLPHLAVMTKDRAVEDWKADRPWRFEEVRPHPAPESTAKPWAERLYSIGASGNPSYEAPRLRYSFGSYTLPGELHELDPATGADVLLKRAQVLGDFSADDYVEHRLWITARDGEKIPVSLVWKPSVCHPQIEGRPAPTFITGYGAYEISSDPHFAVSRLSLMDRGVLYAVVHVRGGGEMGRAWYEQGRRLKKRHSFEDFVDATRVLQDQGWADRTRTVANGGSAGGLLMGAVANMAPDLYAGIEADVPFVDALTSILDPDLPLTVTEWDEWGDPLHEAQVYDYMKSYTPYENVPTAAERRERFGTDHFPKIFVTTSMNDTRVLYVEPLKWIARLQEPEVGADAIVKIEVEAGHGGITGRYKQWEEVSYENAWCLAAMGIRE
ncbi:protease II [Bifidobacterium sp. DSM 109958]|uniref:Protease II n=1 Tax=Bifidobacterium moraviense TaxID=2675323 RepID=A0A7Y0F3R9_9BIFI|nr:S9 family peptidase [Bifidobacterium sp. DSM 109958]NMN00497.1 protease II [Bifidobacterium sp. DSM 109958]